MTNDKDDRLREAAAALGVQLRRLAPLAAEFIRLTDEALLVADPDDARVAEQRLDTLEAAAERLGQQCDRFREARDRARRLWGEDA